MRRSHTLSNLLVAPPPAPLRRTLRLTVWLVAMSVACAACGKADDKSSKAAEPVDTGTTKPIFSQDSGVAGDQDTGSATSDTSAAGSSDAAPASDVAVTDAGSVDAAAPDAVKTDTAKTDTASTDTGMPDTAKSDTGMLDTGVTDTGPPPPTQVATTKGLKVAFIGDSGASIGFAAALDLIKKQGADLVMHQGDFDYEHNPGLFQSLIDGSLGPDFPYFVSVGNHDIKKLSSYQADFAKRLSKVSGAKCTGTIGVQSSCVYKGLHMVFVALGVTGKDHDKFIDKTFAASKHLWKVCSWHKNQADMNTGEKGDETGWEVYKACAKHGAIIATGHEHAYSRTMNLTAIGDKTKGHGAKPPLDVLTVKPGQTFAMVTGTGGKTLRDFESKHKSDTWWATIYTNDLWRKNGQKQTSGLLGNPNGVLFIEFNVDGNPKKAKGTFINTLLSQTVDEFTVFVP